jgi:MoaA/NifB/PqqE/SkfB family radical SAM enzyme
MSLANTFCSSPWFHIRLTYDGSFEECRWFKNSQTGMNIKNLSLREYYNSQSMRDLRMQMLQGQEPAGCATCYYEDKFGKLNGRKRQLLKSAIDVDNFDLTMRSSPHLKHFSHSWQNSGQSDHFPTDLQIDLGNMCNSACIMCDPVASSRLHTDYKKLHVLAPEVFAEPRDFKSWTRDPVLLSRFVTELSEIPDIKYIHFLGGETLYDNAFYDICEGLIASGKSQNTIVGTTTNGTIYNQRLENIIANFQEFHLGISIDSVTELNDYVRYPGRITEILSNTEKFLKLRADHKLYISLRITPNVFTISELDQMFSYMIEHQVVAESCNILYKPEYLRMELMPDDIRMATLQRLDALIIRHGLTQNHQVNIRRTDLISDVIANTIWEYKKFLTDYKVPDNAESLRHQLVTALKAWESLRGNNILDYAPHYEKFLRHYGY